jgi:PhoH-like ATPase
MITEAIPLVSLSGIPGSGKTYLALMAALSELNNGNYERIIYTRPIATVDKGIGFLPGTLEEKFDPFLAPLSDNFQNAFGNLDYFHLLREKKKIDIAPISFIRGRSLKDCFIIVDEAQNATKHELKTIITRVAEGSKIVLIGDTKQIDTQYLDERSNGLTIIADKFKGSKLAAHVHFTKGYRSPLATEADSLIE